MWSLLAFILTAGIPRDQGLIDIVVKVPMNFLSQRVKVMA
jgi:hypothetical protein